MNAVDCLGQKQEKLLLLQLQLGLGDANASVVPVYLRNSTIMESARQINQLQDSLSLRSNVPCKLFMDHKIFASAQGIWGATPPCMLHTFLSNGLVKRLLEAVISLISDNQNQAQVSARNSKKKVKLGKGARLAEFDKRWKHVSRYSRNGNYLRKFNSGISSLTLLTGEDYLHIMMQVRVVLGTDPSFFMDPAKFKDITDSIEVLHEMIFMLWRTDCWNDSEIRELENLIEQ
jgi:hypothetical protein